MPADVILVLNAYVLLGLSGEYSELHQFLLSRGKEFRVAVTDRLEEEYRKAAPGLVAQVISDLNRLEALLVRRRGGRIKPKEIPHLGGQHRYIVSEACSSGAQYLITVYNQWLNANAERLRNYLLETHGLKVISPNGFLSAMERQ